MGARRSQRGSPARRGSRTRPAARRAMWKVVGSAVVCRVIPSVHGNDDDSSCMYMDIRRRTI